LSEDDKKKKKKMKTTMLAIDSHYPTLIESRGSSGGGSR
jgi:hypothetical protein